jgi:hypothetical protein
MRAIARYVAVDPCAVTGVPPLRLFPRAVARTEGFALTYSAECAQIVVQACASHTRTAEPTQPARSTTLRHVRKGLLR